MLVCWASLILLALANLLLLLADPVYLLLLVAVSILELVHFDCFVFVVHVLLVLYSVQLHLAQLHSAMRLLVSVSLLFPSLVVFTLLSLPHAPTHLHLLLYLRHPLLLYSPTLFFISICILLLLYILFPSYILYLYFQLIYLLYTLHNLTLLLYYHIHFTL